MGIIRRALNGTKRLIVGRNKYAIDLGVKLGKNVRIMSGVSFGTEPYLVSIADDVTISNNVQFITHDGGTWAFRDLPEYQDVIKYGKIKVGKRSYIGAHVLIMPGVEIGERCVVGAGAVVTKDVPDGCVVGGVPAKIIKKTLEYAEDCKNKMVIEDNELYYKDKRAYLEKYL